MRLYDTYSRSLVELPPPPGPVRMYFCGPTVYARAHVGNARPFVLGMWLRSWLRATRLRRDPRPQHHRRQRQDLRRRAGRERASSPSGDRLVPRGHGRPRARHARRPAEGDRAHPGDRRTSSSELVETRLRLRRRRRRLLPRRALPRVRAAVGPAARPGRGAGAEPAQGGPARLRALEGERSSARTRAWDSPWGRGRPGWHIECSAMAEELLGPAFEIHGGGLDLVFPHHENEVAQSRALGHEFAHIWAHNGMLQFTGDKMSKSVGNIATIREVLDRVGARGAARLLPRRPLAQADRLLRRDDGAGGARRRRASANVFRGARAAHEGTLGARSPPRSTTTSTRPRRSRVMHELARPRAAAPGARGLRPRLARRAQERAPPEVARAGGAARVAARAERDFETADRLRAEIEAARLGDARRAPAATRSSRGGDARTSSTAGAPCARRCAGRREVLELLATERARRGRAVARRGEGRSVRPERELTRARRDARPPGRRRPGRAVPLRRRLRARRRRAAAARGARPGHRPAQPRRRLPERRRRRCDGRRRSRARLGCRHACRRPVVGRGDRAPADRGRHEPRALPRGGEGTGALGLRRGRRAAASMSGAPTSTGGVALVLGAEGKGLRPLVRRTLRRAGLDPARGRGRVAQRQCGRGGVPVRGAAAAPRQRLMAEPTLYLFDGYNLLHAGPFARPARARRRARELRRRRGARAASSSSTAPATTTTSGPRRALRAGRRHAARAARRRAPLARAGAARLLGRDRARHRRASRWRSSPRRRSSATSSRRGAGRRRPAGSPTSSTTRRGRGSSGSAAAAERSQCK